MKPPIYEDHLAEYSGKFNSDLVSVNFVFIEIVQVVHASSLDILHY